MDLHERLDSGLQHLALDLPPTVREQLIGFVLLLERWNRVYNLSGVRDSVQMLERHVLDSLQVLPYLAGPRIIDVGSGAGLPGLPLALARPDYSFVLLDASAKKTRFLIQAVAETGVGNIEVVRSRVQDYRPRARLDTVITRAFAPLSRTLELTRHLCRDDGLFLTMKGRLSEQELAAVPEGEYEVEILPLGAPGQRRARQLVRVRHRMQTSPPGATARQPG